VKIRHGPRHCKRREPEQNATEAEAPWEGSAVSTKRESGDRPSSYRLESTSEGSVDDDSEVSAFAFVKR
jgi:hypothetical protein